jgi:hypothetical protein
MMDYFGSINYFDDLRRAFYEMISVARPGMSLMGALFDCTSISIIKR